MNDRRFEQLRTEREAELTAIKEAEVSRMAALRAAAAAYQPPVPLSPDTDDVLAEIYDVLRAKLDSGDTLNAMEVAAVYRSFARLLQGAADLTRQLNAEHTRATEATGQVEALTIQVCGAALRCACARANACQRGAAPFLVPPLSCSSPAAGATAQRARQDND